ncbi:MAG: hypothetical protein ABSB96_00475 [Gaiellaceae bacterium]
MSEPVSAPMKPGRPGLGTLAGRLFVTEIVLGGVILLFAIVGMFTGLFQWWAINSATHSLRGWPYLANGFWSAGADAVLLASLAALGTWIVVGDLRERGFRVSTSVAFVALLLGPAGLPVYLLNRRHWLLNGFLAALALLYVAARVPERRWVLPYRYTKALAVVWLLALVFSLSYGPLHPFDTNGSSGVRSTTRPDGEQWELPLRGLSIETLFIHNPGLFDAILEGVEASSAQQRLKDVLVGHWEPWFGPKNADWGPGGLPKDFIKTPLRRLTLPAHATREITVVFRPERCRRVEDRAPVRYVRLRYRLGPLTLAQPFQLPTPLALCDTTRAT